VVKKMLARTTMLRRIREYFASGGAHFRTSGRDQLAQRVAGAWFVWNERMDVIRSARGDGHPDESLRALAKRLDLLHWEE
jgi:hypothetical protein